MKRFHYASLVNFYPNCKEHLDTADKINEYPFHKDINLIKDFLENTDFPGGINVDEQDFKKFIIEENLMVGIDLMNDDLDEYKYLFDAFNVYFCREGSSYYTQDPILTTKWRKTMNAHFPNTSYIAKVKNMIKKEMYKDIDEVIEDYSKQILDLN